MYVADNKKHNGRISARSVSFLGREWKSGQRGIGSEALLADERHVYIHATVPIKMRAQEDSC
jgi:hypothetical protein